MNRTRGLRLLCLGQTLQLAGLSVSMPYLALYLNTDRALGMGLVGVFLAVTVLAGAFGSAVGGRLSDRAGRRVVMVGALVARAAFTWLLAEAIAGGWRLAALAAVQMAGAFLGNLYFPAAQAWVAERWESHERVEAFGWLRVASNLGWAVGPAVGGFFLAGSYAPMFRVTSVVCLLTAAYIRAALPEEPVQLPCAPCASSGVPIPPPNGVAAWLGTAVSPFRGKVDPRFARMCAWTVLLGTVMSQLVAPLSVHAVRYAGVAPGKVGLLFSLNGFLVVALQAPVAKALRGRRISKALWGGSVLYALGYALVGRAGGFAGLAAAMVVITLGEITVSPGLSALSANLAGPGELGRYAGLNGFAHHTGSALGPLLGGAALQYLSPRHPAAPWLLVALLALTAAAGFRGLGRRLADDEDGFKRAPALPEPALEAA
ncbi:MAG: MFS transporter [Elusimicrobia bacterium]|nr:MFS transporter [Elusimicrobiota bacterium]